MTTASKNFLFTIGAAVCAAVIISWMKKGKLIV
jgi:hypothetical protein